MHREWGDPRHGPTNLIGQQRVSTWGQRVFEVGMLPDSLYPGFTPTRGGVARANGMPCNRNQSPWSGPWCRESGDL